MSGEKCPLTAKVYWGAKEKAWLASPILVPCVLPLGHKGLCSAEPKEPAPTVYGGVCRFCQSMPCSCGHLDYSDE